MWSAIGRATARQVRVGGRLPIRLTANLAPRAAPVIPSGVRVAAVFARGYAEAGRPRKTSKTEDSAAPKEKKAATKKRASKKATATKDGTEGAAKPKSPAAKKGKPGRAKKPLTEEEKTRLKIRELRKKALFKEEPSKLPSTKWLAYSNERVKLLLQEDPKLKLADTVRQTAAEYRNLSTAELEKLDAIAQQNRVANEVNYRNWVDNYTVQEIHEANLARHLLRRKYNINAQKPTISDPRFPTKAISAYVAFFKSRFHSPEYEGIDAKGKLVKAAAEWKQLDAEARKPFEEIGATDLARFNKEMEAYRKEAGQE